MYVRTLLIAALTLTVAAGAAAGALAAPQEDVAILRADPVAPRGDAPFPLVLLDPLDAGSLDGAPPALLPESREAVEAPAVLGELPAWQILNWRINSDATTQVQNEEQVAVNPLDPNNLVAVWRDFRLGYRRVGVGYTFDGGVTWHDSLIEHPAYPRHSDPGVTTDSDGNFYVVILSYTGSTVEENGLFVFKSEDGGVTWGDPVAAIDQYPNVFEDKELMACDRTSSLFNGNLYVTWARFGSVTEIKSVTSSNGGASFGTPVTVSDESGVQWPCPVVGPDGTYYVAWVNYYPPEIRIDRSLSGGTSFGTDVTVTDVDAASTTINGGVTVFGFPAMDCDIFGGPFNGRLYIAYMDWGWSDYDIFFRYSDNHGTTWSAPVRLNDDAIGNGCDQFHPWTCVSEDGVVSVIFYDRRNDPSNLLMDLYLTQSFDGGVTFGPNRRITTVSSDPTAGSARAGIIGEYIGLAAASGDRLHPVWTDTREGDQDVYTSIVDTTFAGTPDDAVVAGLQLMPPRPNPSFGAAHLSALAPRADEVTVEICDVAGRMVREYQSAADAHGLVSVTWDGRNASGESVAPGVYFVRATDGTQAATAKLVRLK